MSDLTLILLSAGSSSRFGLDVKKHWLRIEHQPLWNFVAHRLQKSKFFVNVIIVASKDEISFMKNYAEYTFVTGGKSRQESLSNAMEVVKSEFVLVSDIARACIGEDFLERIIALKGKSDCIVPFLKVTDTIVYEDETIDREKVKRIQTPQLSRSDILRKALQTETEYTDESSAIVAFGGTREFILGEESAHKITYVNDLNLMPCLKAPVDDTLSGNGFDVHAFEDGGQMWLGGVKIDSEFSFKAHSDGDVALHSLIDALLGAAGVGDIGELFPDTDAAYEGIDSKLLLERAVTMIHNFGFEIINVDITIMAQTPKLMNYKQKMAGVIAKILGIAPIHVNVKATTTEKLGFVGRKEGVAVDAIANLKYYN